MIYFKIILSYFVFFQFLFCEFYPENGKIFNYTHILFSWDQFPHANYYELIINNNIDNSQLIKIKNQLSMNL